MAPDREEETNGDNETVTNPDGEEVPDGSVRGAIEQEETDRNWGPWALVAGVAGVGLAAVARGAVERLRRRRRE